MKEVEFESANSLHRNWEKYNKKHHSNKDIEVLCQLLNSSDIARNEEEILAVLYDSLLAVLDSTRKLDTDQKTRALYLSYNLCSCEACQKECGAHINKKGQIRISQKIVNKKLNTKTPLQIVLHELMYTLLHQILHGIFPDLKEEIIIEKTEQVWKSGISELKKEKLNDIS
jgi:hypothetical protein